jgi:hypothetical protein
MSFTDRLSHAWNAFMGRDPTELSTKYPNLGYASYYQPDRPILTRGNDRSIVNAIFNRIAMDVAQRKIVHAETDENGKFIKEVDSYLNQCLKMSANIDQTGRSFIQDAVITMLDSGVVAITPIDTTVNPELNAFDIKTMRVGRVLQWYPEHVRLKVYNEKKGEKQEITVPKSTVAIVENPLYSIMNDPNSILQRLIRKLNLLDAIDEQSGSGKLDLIVQLPYIIRSDARRAQAEERRKNIEDQLNNSKFGIAYTDGTEKITQLNRPLENNIMSQVEYLTSMLYSQLGMPESVFKGEADERVMLNYINRTIEPILSALTNEMTRKFLSQNARTRGQSILFFEEPFRLMTATNVANIADTLTRNEILSSNELRALLGFRPVDDSRADELRNKNLNASEQQMANPIMTTPQGEGAEQVPSNQGNPLDQPLSSFK